MLTGWSPGANERDPGNIDISTSLPITTEPDQTALALGASPRPIIGTNVLVTASNVPAGAPFGAFLFGLTQFNPGVDLAPLGMPGCKQFLGIAASLVFLPTGSTGTMTYGVPNNAAFSGVHIQLQAASFAAGANATGVITSNGVDLGIGTQ